MKKLRSTLIVLTVLTLVGCGNTQVETDNDLIHSYIMVAMDDNEGGEWVDHEMVQVEVTNPDEPPFERVETVVPEGSYGEGVHFAATTDNKLEDKYLKVFNESKSDSVYLYVLFTNAGLGKSKGQADSEIQFGIDRKTGDLLNLDNYYKSAISYKVMSKKDVFSELEIEEVAEIEEETVYEDEQIKGKTDVTFFQSGYNYWSQDAKFPEEPFYDNSYEPNLLVCSTNSSIPVGSLLEITFEYSYGKKRTTKVVVTENNKLIDDNIGIVMEREAFSKLFEYNRDGYLPANFAKGITYTVL